MKIHIEQSRSRPIEENRIEIVERKGLGHPDTICDLIANDISIALCREYQIRFGHILHHNVDKALLLSGSSKPRFGGGQVIEPMQFILGGHVDIGGGHKKIDVNNLCEASARGWLQRNLRYVDSIRDVNIDIRVGQGSSELRHTTDPQNVRANDTSAAVGCAPYSRTESLVLTLERHLNSADVKSRLPFVGEDIKIMARREQNDLSVTLAVAFVDKCIGSVSSYFEAKEVLSSHVRSFISAMENGFAHVEIQINALDAKSRGMDGLYLTVSGTSAECGDSGQVGRGNRVNGLITFARAQGMEAAAGKNPLNHVGKIYSHFSHFLAHEIYREVAGTAEVTVEICGRIGDIVSQPDVCAIKMLPRNGFDFGDAETVVEKSFAEFLFFERRLIAGEFSPC